MDLNSRHYSHETLFIPVLFTENTIHSRTITKNTDIIILFMLALIIIRTAINFFLFSKFLPMSNAKYVIKHNHAVE